MKQRKRHGALQVQARGAGSNLHFALRSAMDCCPFLFLGYAAKILCSVGVPIASVYLPKIVIQKITGHGQLMQLILSVLLFMGSIAVMRGVATFTTKYCYFQKLNLNAYYLRKLTHKGLTTDYENQENERFRKLQEESSAACNGNYSPMTEIYDIFAELMAGILGVGAYLAILIKLSPVIICLLIAATFGSFFLNRRIIHWEADHADIRIDHRQRTSYINATASDVRSAKDIRLYKMQIWLDHVYHQNMEQLRIWYQQYTKKIFGVSVFDGLLGIVRDLIAYAYLIFLVMNEKIEVADFVLYFGVVTGFSVWLSGILGQFNALHRVSLAFDHFREYLEFPDTYRRSDGISCDTLLTAPRRIELKNVRYRYDGAQKDTLCGIDLTLEPGEHLAIVGLNGAGKTTLVKVLCGLADPTQGQVFYDGIDIRNYNRCEYYRLFSAVFQQFSLLPVTIAEIVAEAMPEEIDMLRVKTCLQQAGLWERVAALPNGMNSSFSRTIHDDGVEFSGGEVQKLLLARALYRQSPIMILDEPTAALDPIAENRLYQTYNTLMTNRSTIFISHRLASTRFCSRIILMEDGKIIESGTHDALLAQKGKYYQLFQAQAQYYQQHPGNEEGNE